MKGAAIFGHPRPGPPRAPRVRISNGGASPRSAGGLGMRGSRRRRQGGAGPLQPCEHALQLREGPLAAARRLDAELVELRHHCAL